MIIITPDLSLEEGEIFFRFIRSSGPGGQNVNKVATAVQLRFHVLHSKSLPEDVRQRLMQQNKNIISKEGFLSFTAQRYRTQERNRHDAIERLIILIKRAAIKPKKRKKTKVPKNQKRRRLESKRRRGEIKKGRKMVGGES